MELARSAFLMLRTTLDYDKIIRPMMNRYSGGLILDYWYIKLISQLDEPSDASEEFLDADLESLRLALVDAIHEFADRVGKWTFPMDRGSGNSLPPELKHADPNGIPSTCDRDGPHKYGS